MAEAEGVIKFSLDFQEVPDLERLISRFSPSEFDDINAMMAWRESLCEQGLVGQDPERYLGYGFGNLSVRTANSEFVITGSQTGSIARLGLEHCALVTRWDAASHSIAASGMLPPSSEALTHAAVYDAAPGAKFVFHAHSPDIWQNRNALGIPGTAADVEYGTAAMATAVAELLAHQDLSAQGLFAMAGHEDGVVAFAGTADDAGQLLLDALSRGTQL